MSFVRKGKYYLQSDIDPRYTVAAVCVSGVYKFEAWFKERISHKQYETTCLGIFPTADEAKAAAIEHKKQEPQRNEQRERERNLELRRAAGLDPAGGSAAEDAEA